MDTTSSAQGKRRQTKSTVAASESVVIKVKPSIRTDSNTNNVLLPNYGTSSALNKNTGTAVTAGAGESSLLVEPFKTLDPKMMAITGYAAAAAGILIIFLLITRVILDRNKRKHARKDAKVAKAIAMLQAEEEQRFARRVGLRYDENDSASVYLEDDVEKVKKTSIVDDVCCS